MTTLIISLIIGGFLILLGWAVKSNPSLIAGYNAHNHNQKIIIPSLIKKTSIITGLIIILGNLFSYIIGWDVGAFIFLTFPMFLMVTYLLLKINSSKKLLILSIGLIIPIFISIQTFALLKEPKISIENNCLNISGQYGEVIMMDSIKEISILESIPRIKIKTNGFSLGKVQKGYFILEEMGAAKLFVNSKYAPFLELKTSDGRLIIINFEDSNKTNNVYNLIIRHEK